MIIGGGQQEKLKFNNVSTYFFIFLCIYAVLIVSFSFYSFNFDDGFFYIDILSNRLIFNGIGIEGGRFFPLASMELNILMHISHSPYIYFGFNACILLCLGVLFYKICCDVFGGFSYLALFASIVVFVNPAFVIPIFGICYPEKMLCLFLLLFIFANYRILVKKQYKFIYLALFASNYAIYLKEPVFIIIGGFGFLYLLFSFKKLSKIEIYYCLLLVFSALIFLCIYIFYVIPNVINFYGHKEAENIKDKIIIFISSIRAIGMVHIWFVVLLPLIILFRIIDILRYKKFDSQMVFFDILLLCGFLYFVAYCILGLFRVYYFMPIYFIIIFSMLYYAESLRNMFTIKIAFILCVALYMLNAFPQAIWQISFLKSQGVALKQTLEFLDSYNDRKNIYFYGLGRSLSTEEYFINHFGLYLEKIYKIDDFDILTDVQNDNDVLWNYNYDSRLTILNSKDISVPKSGDLVILNANSHKYVDTNDMSSKYELLFKTNVIGLPHITFKTIVKYVLHKTNLIHYRDENFFRMPINNYIYRIR